ncbi:kinase-like protein [Gonapodya prolifera JEL478]|uniref:Kinase-like protein n=1 Tax=Gonapodya prolifera (strain JEL478) TaxID=1344416 RepID=A0A138ZYK0_GONPJ|nr:kinase-like protein [Gonapodya prolifera JEL478]|eukprot:KXS09577.1 kinase-like protein [Gonapodya prolifera JEL478]
MTSANARDDGRQFPKSYGANNLRPNLQSYATISHPPFEQSAHALVTTAHKFLSKYPLHPRFMREYQIMGELGDGGFGFVISAVQRISERPVAVKFVFKSRVPSAGWVRDPSLGICPLEVYILKNLRHRSIIEFIEYLEDERFCYIVMELHGVQWTKLRDSSTREEINKQPVANVADAPNHHTPQHMSTLQIPKAANESPSTIERPKRPVIERLNSEPPPLLTRKTSMDLFECIEQVEHLTEEQSRFVFRQIAEAVAYLHAKGIVHRDLKDENIVIDEKLHAKLIDFGSAAIEPRPTQQNHLFDHFYGTIQYAAPEILRGEKYRGRPNDMWALGILLYTILFGESPFASTNQALKSHYRPFSKRISSECADLLDRLLSKSWKDRITSGEVLRHPWLRKSTKSRLFQPQPVSQREEGLGRENEVTHTGNEVAVR